MIRNASSRQQVQTKKTKNRFVFSEAKCNDDEEHSEPEEDQEEDTDLSGFIVDDGADLSYDSSSDGDSIPTRKSKSVVTHTKPRRRLQRGSPQRRRLETMGDAEGPNEDTDTDLALTLEGFGLEEKNNRGRKASIEVIDLTESPEKNPTRPPLSSAFSSELGHEQDSSPISGLLRNFSESLRLPPPSFDLLGGIPQKQRSSGSGSHMSGAGGLTRDERYTTPPATPPRSPSKLKSPSKLLSPSKRDAIARSPHRQSTDAFWDLHTINDWNDENSPKKPPAASPGKRALARFQIWSDDSDDEQLNDGSSSSLPSPCSSPTKPRSPVKSPEKAERQRLAAAKQTSKARKAAFDAAKETMAQELFDELDKHITSSKLTALSASTGGVKIIWSKTLRSTAGRANWRRTVTKPTASPIKGNTIPSGPGVTVEHFANIELASKVIDSEDRLVNTLAHEFCHLANFMVSNIRDQPHGASFKAWAKKATTHLQKSDNELWRKVEVTTKHSYKIDHKYLWLCAGRERSKAAEFLNIKEDEGCGAEYGRHSKSIDTDTQRCGRCKGKLLQVRPKPRESPVKKSK